jgi:hypothetical protein
MALLRYDQARPWAKAIRDEVLERRMPPWAPVKGIGEFQNDASLSQPEIDILVGWVEGGAPEGDPIYLPALPPGENRAAAQPEGRPIALKQSLTLTAAARLTAIRPRNLAEHSSFELAAIQPNGAVARLIWIRDYREKWNRTYVLREPLPLPRGTRLVVYPKLLTGTVNATVFTMPLR